MFGSHQKNTSHINVEHRPPSHSHTDMSITSLPIVDLSLSDEEAAAQLGNACRTIGFFIITNHGIAPQLIKTVFAHSKILFKNLSPESKSKRAIRPDNRGYSSFATEKLDPSSSQNDNKECFNFVPDDERALQPSAFTFDSFRNPVPSDRINNNNDNDVSSKSSGDEEAEVEESATGKNKMKENIRQQDEFAFRWPSAAEGAPEDLRTVMLSYINEVMKVSDRLHRLFAIDLKLDNPQNFFRHFFENPMATLRLLRYPGSGEEEKKKNDDDGTKQDEVKISAGEHTDYDSITFLVTDSTPGLQVRNRETNAWIDAPTFPKESLGEFIIVNIADCLQRWTNDLYKSTPHRVLQPKSERYSCALFVGPAGETKIEALPGTGEPKYPPTTAFEHLMMKLGATYKF